MKCPNCASLLSSLALFVLVLSCQGAQKAPAPGAETAKAPVKAEKLELNVYIWTNYHSEKAISQFEQETGSKVVIDTYDNNEVIEQKLQSGTAPYDIVVPSDYMVSSLGRQGLLLPLDEAKLLGLESINPRLDWGKNAGEQRFSVPYLWGTTGFAYRTDKVAPAPDSWSVVFDPRFKGRVVMLDDMREDFAVALKSLGFSANSTQEPELLKAREKLVAQKPLVLAYDSSDFAGKIQAGDAWVVHGYSGELARVARSSQGKVGYAIPKEGAMMAVDNLAIPKAARDVELAYKFINFMLRPDIAAETTNATGYPTANAAALPKVKPELAGDPAVFPPDEVLSRCELMKDLGESTARLDELWTEIKAH